MFQAIDAYFSRLGECLAHWSLGKAYMGLERYRPAHLCASNHLHVAEEVHNYNILSITDASWMSW